MNEEITKILEDIEKCKTGVFAFKSYPIPLINYEGMLLKIMRFHINGRNYNNENFHFSWIIDGNNTCEKKLSLVFGKKSNNSETPLKFFLFENDNEILSYKNAYFINISIEAFDDNHKIGKNNDINDKVFLIGVNFLNSDGEYFSSLITSNDEVLKKYVQITDKINSGRNSLWFLIIKILKK